MRRSAFFRVCPQFRINRAAGVFAGFAEPSVKGLAVGLIEESHRFFLARTASRPGKLLLHFRVVTLHESPVV